MIPTELRATANEIFREMGGYDYASLVISDKEIIDTCLYSGIVIIFSPKENAIYGLGGSFLNDYNEDYDLGDEIGFTLNEVYDLSIYGYSASSPYYVLDSNFSLIYYSYGKSLLYQGNLGSYFGLNPKDSQYIANLEHGTIFYIQFESLKGPQLIKVVVNDRPHPEIYAKYLYNYRKRKRTINYKNDIELNILPEGLPEGDIIINTLEGSLTQDLNYSDLLRNPNIISTTQKSDRSINFRINHSLWFNLMFSSPYESRFYSNLISKSIQEAEYSLSLDSFRLLYDIEPQYLYSLKNTSLVFSKPLLDLTDSSFLQVTLHIDDTSYVDDITVLYLTPLKLENINGKNLQSLTDFGEGLYHIGLEDKLKLSRSTLVLSPQNIPTTSLITLNATLSLG